MAKPTLYTPEMYAEYTGKGYWNDLTLSDFWDRNASIWPDKEAVVDHRSRLTWSQAKRWTDNTSLGLLELGLKRDSLVVIQLPNWAEIPLLRMCCEKAGLLCVPVLRTLRETEMEYVLKHSEAEALIITARFRGFDYWRMVASLKPSLPNLKHVIVAGDEVPEGAISLSGLAEGVLPDVTPDGAGGTPPGGACGGVLTPDYLATTKYPASEFSLVLLTSGSTGVPKFVEHPICSRAYLGRAYAEVTGLTSEDVVGMLAPAFVGPNSLAYYGAPQAGAKIVMLEHFDVESALKLIERERITIIGVVPTQLAMVLALPDLSKYDLKSLRLVICTGAPLPYRVALEAEDRLGAPLIQFYGNVDGGGSTFPSLQDSPEVRHLTVGKPIPGDDIKLIDDNGALAPTSRGGIGEVLVRGATIVSGYYKDPAMNAACWTADGFFKTGDYGKWDDYGNLLIAGRKKDMIIRGGQNVYPAEVENLLVTHPAVRDVAVVGMPDAVMGEKVCAFVVPKAGKQFTFDGMIAFLKGKAIAPYKLPERLELMDRLPMVANDQKVNKPALREAIARKVGEEKGEGREKKEVSS